VQVGTRASRHDRGHWEKGLGVRQFWAEECRRDPPAALDAIVAHVKSTGVSGVYFSNDIDGTDAAYTEATGTPEPGGLAPDFVVALIRRLGREIGLVGGDIMEVAPPLGAPAGSEATVELGARYFRETVLAALT
jgi:agmatinase